MPVESQGSPVASPLPTPPTQRQSRQLIAVVFAGIVLRIVVLLLRGGDLNTDPDAYVAHAQTLLETGSFCVPGTQRPTAFRPPVYPIALAAFGFPGVKFSTAAALINLVSAAILIIATWWIARIVQLQKMWPTICATAVALDPMLLRYTVLPMTELLSAALLSLAILQTLKLWYNQSIDRTSLNTAIGAGLCFGFGGLCRPIIFLVCAVVSIAMTVQFACQALRKKDDLSQQKPLSSLFILPAVIAGLVLLPWVIRNAMQFNQFIPATTHGGYTLLLGNNPVFYNEVVLPPEHPPWQNISLTFWQTHIQQNQDADAIDPADEVAIDRWNYDRASRNIHNQPHLFHQAILLRWRRFWALRPSVQTSGSIVNGITAIWYGATWLGLLTSLYVWVIRRRARVHLMFWTLLSFVLVHSVYWTNARMRAPLSAVIFVLAGVGWQHLYQTLAGKVGSRKRMKLSWGENECGDSEI